MLIHKKNPEPCNAEVITTSQTMKNWEIIQEYQAIVKHQTSFQRDQCEASLKQASWPLDPDFCQRESLSGRPDDSHRTSQPMPIAMSRPAPPPRYSITSEAGDIGRETPQETSSDARNRERAPSQSRTYPSFQSSALFIPFLIPPPRGAVLIPPQENWAVREAAIPAGPDLRSANRRADGGVSLENRTGRLSGGIRRELSRSEEIVPRPLITSPSVAGFDPADHSLPVSYPSLPHTPPSTPETAVDTTGNHDIMGPVADAHYKKNSVFTNRPRPAVLLEGDPRQRYGAAVAAAMLTVRVPTRNYGPTSRISRRSQGSVPDRNRMNRVKIN